MPCFVLYYVMLYYLQILLNEQSPSDEYKSLTVLFISFYTGVTFFPRHISY